MSICHPPRDNDIIPIADWLDRFGGQNKSLAVEIEGQSCSEGTNEIGDFVAVENSPTNKQPVLRFRRLSSFKL